MSKVSGDVTSKKLLKMLRDAKAARSRYVKNWKAQALRNDPDRKISCKRGCHGCCYQLALVSTWEGALIAHYLIQTNQPKLLKAATEQGQRALGRIGPDYSAEAINAVTSQWLDDRIPCPFLKDGECVIYGLRPVACSSYFVCSPPEVCFEPSGAEVLALNNASPLTWGLRVDERITAWFLKLDDEPFMSLPHPLGRAVDLGAKMLQGGPGALRADDLRLAP